MTVVAAGVFIMYWKGLHLRMDAFKVQFSCPVVLNKLRILCSYGEWWVLKALTTGHWCCSRTVPSVRTIERTATSPREAGFQTAPAQAKAWVRRSWMNKICIDRHLNLFFIWRLVIDAGLVHDIWRPMHTRVPTRNSLAPLKLFVFCYEVLKIVQSLPGLTRTVGQILLLYPASSVEVDWRRKSGKAYPCSANECYIRAF